MNNYMRIPFLNNSLVSKFLLLFVTGVPGLYKLVILFSIKYSYEDHTVGVYVNDTSVALVLGFFTYVNISQYVVKDIPLLQNEEKHSFLNILMKQTLKYAFVGFLIGLILAWLKIVQDIYGFTVFLFFSSFYYVLRYYYIVERAYFKLLIFEMILLTVSLANVFLSSPTWLLTLNGLSFAVFDIIVFIDLKLYRYKSNNIRLSKIVSAKQLFHYGLLNITASGLYLCLPALSFHMLPVSYTVLIGIVNNVTSVLLLFTRSVSYHYSPLLAKTKNNSDILSIHLEKFKKNLVILLFAGSVICVASVFLISELKNDTGLLSLNHAVTIIILFILMITVNQFSLPSSSLLVILNQEINMLKSNILQTLVFILAVFLLLDIFNADNVIKFDAILLVLIVTSLLRNIYLIHLEKKTLLNMNLFSKPGNTVVITSDTLVK